LEIGSGIASDEYVDFGINIRKKRAVPRAVQKSKKEVV
jgi:hypothetical protein